MKPMLAAATDGTNLSYPLLLSPKLDGVRCLIIDGVAMSRSLKPIPSAHVQRLFGQARYNGLDGELVVGSATAPDVYTCTTSGVMSHEGSPEVAFHVFDDLTIPGPFHVRLTSAQARSRKAPQVVKVPHIEIYTEAELLQAEQTCLAQGYEGVMLRSFDGGYKHGRSTLREGLLMKLKRFEDAEAEILGCLPLLTNTNEAVRNELGQLERSSKKAGRVVTDQLGALQVRDLKTGVEFDIGTGFDQLQRQRLWATRTQLLGQLVRYKYQPTGVKTKPRFPVFLGFRDPIDL